MKILSLTVSLVAILACLADTPVAAQQGGFEPRTQLHAVNPSMSLTAPTNNPLQDQMRQDYAAGLMGAQRNLLQQNPSGLGRQEQAIGRELNGYSRVNRTVDLTRLYLDRRPSSGPSCSSASTCCW